MQQSVTAVSESPLGLRGAELERALRKRWNKALWERVIVLSLWLCGTVSMVTTVLIVLTLADETRAFFAEVSLRDFLLDTKWTPQFEPTHFGIWPLVFGTLNVLLWSMVIALPLGLATAVYLSEYAHPNTRRVMKPVVEALAGVPTVVYAFFALTVVTQEFLRPLLGQDRVPIFNALSASIVMAIMILPTIASVSEDAMSNVPRELREGAYGLGATRLEVAFRVVFPAALGGIIAAVLLAVARVIGETMIVAVAAGSTPQLTLNPLNSVQTMTGYMLQIGLGDSARGTIDYTSIFAVGSTLFVFTLIANVAAGMIVKRFKEQYE
ncbi:phosphate ABC transporter permease subunit PstC [Tepidiforma sp.]|uniref:phosphate ABC transporter permease subunit PstC n=1 Tax=Tepidiforma sp. TaxID=2682230 RepID=UPI002ADE60CB|nr:phosphate ABC transporter permease subunit PstC [Tepidiforma sp.]